MRPQEEMNKDIQTLLNEGMELNVWMVSKAAREDKGFMAKHGAFGAAFYYEDEPPQCTEDAEYGNSPLGAIENALKRWR